MSKSTTRLCSVFAAGWLLMPVALPEFAWAQATSSDQNNVDLPAAAESDEPPVSALPITRFEAQIEFDQLVTEQRYDEALPVGQQMLALTITEYGEESREAALAHTALADTQRTAGKYDDAELNYLRAIEVFRSLEGPFSSSVIYPTIGLGDSYYYDGQYTNAVSVYDEARNVQRRNYGLLSEEQIVILDRMSHALIELELYEDANKRQLEALSLSERNYEVASPEYLEGIYRYARWLRAQRRYLEERNQYDRATRLIREAHGKESVLLVHPYREIGNSFRIQSFDDPQGVSALNRAYEILRQQEVPDPLEMAKTLVDLGDWRTAFNSVNTGSEYYLLAWNLLDEVDNGAALRTEWFNSRRAIPVFFVNMSTRGFSRNPDDGKSVAGAIIVQFDVNTAGRTENVSILSSDPPGFKDVAATRSIRQSRFRPHIENGEFVPAIGLGFRFEYFYHPESLDSDRDND